MIAELQREVASLIRKGRTRLEKLDSRPSGAWWLEIESGTAFIAVPLRGASRNAGHGSVIVPFPLVLLH